MWRTHTHIVGFTRREWWDVCTSMDLAHTWSADPDFNFYMFLAEAWIASAVLYACTDFGLCFFPGVFLSSRVTGACPVTTDLIMRVNVRTTTTTTATRYASIHLLYRDDLRPFGLLCFTVVCDHIIVDEQARALGVLMSLGRNKGLVWR